MPRARRPVAAILSSAATVLLLGACTGQEGNQPPLLSLDRPTDVAFTCYGRLRITNGEPATTAQPLVSSSQPLESCRIRSQVKAESVPPGQQDLDNQILEDTHAWYAFILQSVPGTVAVARADVKQPGETYEINEIAVQDATSLTPGKNSLSVGSLPVGIAGDATGCYMVTANAGSCDLSIIDVDRAINRSPEPTVRKQAVLTPGGATVLAKPAAILASGEDRDIGVACPAEPDGLYFVAYPDCHAVAVLRADTGVVQSSIRFADDGTATIADGELQCAEECGGAIVAEGARPVTLDVIRDDRVGTIRLAIGLDNRPVITVVDLDADWSPVQIEQIELSGDVGVLDVSISPQIGVGGFGMSTLDDANGTDQAQFVYAVATDGSVRVAEIFDQDTECDAQADPRFLLDTADASLLTCIPAGLPGSPPRRALAEGPGIRVPGDAVPVSVAIARSGVGLPRDAIAPTTLIGTFAYIGLSSGVIAIANVDDDNYEDLQLTAEDPFQTQLPLAMPHQLRDSFPNRAARTQTTVGTQTLPICLSNGVTTNAGGPRAQDPPLQAIRASAMAEEKAFELPYLRQFDCNGNDGRRPVTEVEMNAPDGIRLETFPDWRGLEIAEAWSLTWEGSLSNDNVNTAIDGPAVRSGYVEIAGGGIRVHDDARPFCQVGVEDRDQVVLRGCDPARGDAQCGAGQTCYVHPDSTQAAGACLPKDKVSELAGACRDFLVSSRRFAVKRAFAETLELIERRRVLRTTPLGGCTSAEQCQMLATYEDQLKGPDAPLDDETPASTRTFACEVDPSRPPIGGVDIDRCVQTCTSSAECGAGGKCSGNRCIEAPVPPPECVVGLQKYEIQASDAFVVLGSTTGYLHSMTADPTTGRCVKDPDANPLLLGRIPLVAPACGVDAVGNVTPNPCSIEVNHTEQVPVFNNACEQTGNTIQERATDAIRFRNPGMTLNLVDPTYPGDARCIGDRGGGLVGVPIVHPGYLISFGQVAGFSTMAVASVRAAYLARLVRGPDSAIWAVDEGDILTGQLNSRGAVFRFSHDPLGGGLVIR